MTRLYIELKPELRDGTSREELSQEFVMSRAEEIFEPFHLRWKYIGKFLSTSIVRLVLMYIRMVWTLSNRSKSSIKVSR